MCHFLSPTQLLVALAFGQYWHVHVSWFSTGSFCARLCKSDGSCRSGGATVGGMKGSDPKGTVVGAWLLSLKLRLVVLGAPLAESASTVDLCLRVVPRSCLTNSRFDVVKSLLRRLFD